MKKSLLLSTVGLLLLSAIPAMADEKLYYDVDFSSPAHIIGQPPTVVDGPPIFDNTRKGPTEIVFGNPIVVESYSEFTDQPLLFNALGDTEGSRYDQIQLDMDRGTGFYYISFDVLTYGLNGSRSWFDIIFDLPTVHTISLNEVGNLTMLGQSMPYQDDTPMHFEILMDITNDYAKVSVNEELLYDGIIKFAIGPYFDPYEFTSLRFNHAFDDGGGEFVNDTYVALDNIIVANYIVPEPATLSLLALGGLALLRKRK